MTHTKAQLLTLWNARVTVSQRVSCLDRVHPVTVNPGDEALASEYETTRDSLISIENLLLQLPEAWNFTNGRPHVTSSARREHTEGHATHSPPDHAKELEEVISKPFREIQNEIQRITNFKYERILKHNNNRGGFKGFRIKKRMYYWYIINK